MLEFQFLAEDLQLGATALMKARGEDMPTDDPELSQAMLSNAQADVEAIFIAVGGQRA